MRLAVASAAVAALGSLALAGCDTLPERVTEDPDALNRPAVVVASGAFVDKGGQMTSGAYRIERAGADLRLVLDSTFRTDDGPDLHVVLSPLAVAEAGNRNATDGGRIVAPLKAERGPQLFDLPDDLDVGAYRSVLVHCVQYRHLFGAAPLARTAR